MKERDGVKEVEKVCKAAMKLTPEDFKAVDEVIASQEEYNHPLKMGTAIRQGKLAEHNRRVSTKLKELIETIKLGAGI